MALSDFFKKKKEYVKNNDFLEDRHENKIKDLEKENEALKKINELSEKEIELLNEVNEVLEKMNELSEGKIVRLDKENKELRYKVRDFKMRR